MSVSLWIEQNQMMLEVIEYNLLSLRSTSYLVIEVGLESKTSDSLPRALFPLYLIFLFHIYIPLSFLALRVFKFWFL